MNTRILRGDHLDGVNGLDGVAPGFFLTGGNGESEAVDDDVFDPKVPFPDQCVDQAACDTHFVDGGAGLTLLINGQRNHGSAVFFDQGHHCAKT